MLSDQHERNLELRCYASKSLLMPVVRTEVLNVDPPIVKYHDMIPQETLQAFAKELERVRLMPSVSWGWGGVEGYELFKFKFQKILVADSLGRDIWQDSIVVNGSFVHPMFSEITRRTFDAIQRRISAFSLRDAELFHVCIPQSRSIHQVFSANSTQFQIKKYRPGGHYAPHLDYLIINPEPELGNRIATFMLIVQPAGSGGGTIFPAAGVHFQPKAGDAILWLNQQPDYGVADGSFHGACPVLDGVKLGVTMWIRSVGQELRLPCPLEKGRPFDYRLMTHPSPYMFRPLGSK